MEPNVNDPLLCVVCRFVPYDQWLITHLDPSWNVKQVKLWILSKCNLVDAPDLPRFRAVSPITFASHPRGASFDASNGDDSDDEGGNESSSVEDGARHSMTNRKLAESWPSHVPRRRSESHIDKAPPAVDLSSRYTILTFSNTHILEDAFVLSHYKIHPHELLEIHPTGSIVRLQREVMVQYIRPYFEAPVKALRKTPSSSKEGFIDRVGAGRSKSAKMAGKARLVSSDPLVYGMFGERSEPKKKKTTKLEWRERWVVIHEGVLSLCNDRSDPNPSQRIPLSSFVAFRGGEHLKNTRAPPVIGQRIVCAKFSVPSSGSHSRKQAEKNRSTSSSSTLQQHTTRHPRMLSQSQPQPSEFSSVATSQSPTSSLSSHSRTPASSSFPTHSTSSLSRRNASVSSSASVSECDEDDEVERAGKKRIDKGKAREVEDTEKTQAKDIDQEDAYEWIIMDFCDDNAFTAILRILHRHSPRPITSSFLPQSSTLISNTTQPPASPISPHPPMELISPFSNTLISPFDSSTMYPMSLGTIPYPEWRMDVVNRARQSGLGYLDKGMEWFLGGEYGDYSRAKARSVGKDSPLTSGSTSGRPRRDAMKSATSDVTISGRDVLPVTEAESDAESDDLELSDCEWQGWTLDLDRQAHVQDMRRADEANRKRQTTSSIIALSPPPSSHSSWDASHIHFTSALSPSTTADSSSLMHPGQISPGSQQSIDDDSPITGTVSVSSKPTHVRQRSSTVTAGGPKLLRKKDKSKEMEEGQASAPDTHTVKRKKSILSRAHLSLAFSDPSTSDSEDFQLAKTTAISQSPPRTSILRHARSASNLQNTRLVHAEAINPAVGEDPDVPIIAQGERKTGIVKGVSAQAERLLAKGWDSTLGFVDGRIGFGAGSFYG